MRDRLGLLPGEVDVVADGTGSGVTFPQCAGRRDLCQRLVPLGIAGGAVYDALVAGAALEHQVTLATRDSRALETYRALGATLEIIG